MRLDSFWALLQCAASVTILLSSPACQRLTEGTGAGECNDGADNDGDGLFDCADSDCNRSTNCAAAADDDDDSGAPYSTPFVMVADAAGLSGQDRSQSGLGGSGAAVADVNSDGWPDLYLCGSAGPTGAVANRLFINDGKGAFVDERDLWGLPSGTDANSQDDPLAIGATFADYDNDGDADLFLSNDGPNQLFRNEGGHFVDHTVAAGLPGQELLSAGMVLGDYDDDGLLDLFVVHHQDLSLPDDLAFANRPADRLYRNLGDGSFEDVTALIPQTSPHGAGFAAAWLDVDDDGDLDLYVANDHGNALQPNQLYRNDGPGQDGWTFTAISQDCGCSLSASAMGLGIGDYNRDGSVDLYVSNLLLDGGEVLLRGQGDGTFVDVSLSARAVSGSAGLRESSWGVEFIDYDNDGWQDLFVAFGSWQDQQFPSAAYLLQNQQGQFNEVKNSGTEEHQHSSEGLVRLDYNRDGCVDVLVTNIDGPPELYRNSCASGAHWVGFDLHGTTSNRDAVGATVFLYQGEDLQRVDVGAGSTSIHSSSSKSVHFGLGDQNAAERVEVRWPSGAVTTLQDLASDRYYQVLEGTGLVP
jgi:enediyne biosynthesis protein E4